MVKRDLYSNIPTEILGTFETVVRTGSYTKAGEQLALSQPAISWQMKRIQSFVGGPLLRKSGAGMVPTERGKLVIAHAQKILELNDQLLRLGGVGQATPSVRLGMTPIYATQFVAEQPRGALSNVILYVDCARKLSEGIFYGYIDLACFPVMGEQPSNIIREFNESLVWVRARDFVMSPGAPIPIITSIESADGEAMIRSLEQNELNYRIAMSCTDQQSKFAAVSAGLGLSSFPDRNVPDPLVVAREYYLPPIPPVRTVICARAGFEAGNHASLVTGMSAPFLKEKPAKPALAS